MYKYFLCFISLFKKYDNNNIIFSEKISVMSLIIFKFLHCVFVMFIHSLFSDNTLFIRIWWMSRSLLFYPLLNTRKFSFSKVTSVWRSIQYLTQLPHQHHQLGSWRSYLCLFEQTLSETNLSPITVHWIKVSYLYLD